MKVIIIGAGAMGLLLAARLFQAGVNVQLVTRSLAQANTLRAKGLKLSETERPVGSQTDGTAAILQVPAFAFAEWEALQFAASAEPVNPMRAECKQSDTATGSNTEALKFILLMVKQTSITDELAFALSKQFTSSTRLVCFQNGIGHIDMFSRHIQRDHIWIAVTTEGACKQADHHVRHTGQGATWLGAASAEASTRIDVQTGQILQNLLLLAGFSASVSNNINSRVWNKLLINAVINPLTAILRVRNGHLPRTPAALPLMRSLLAEAALVADKLGIELAADLWEQVLLVCERTADNHSSMLQDVMAGRRTEIEAITGGLLRAAHRLHLELPANAAVYAMVRSIEQQLEI